ncbi:MAG: hypothetical protein KPEEDBHJ_01844 [Anaerolineales bacterium]|nr:hypothetical protein [Anaerolineales bacterium]
MLMEFPRYLFLEIWIKIFDEFDPAIFYEIFLFSIFRIVSY